MNTPVLPYDCRDAVALSDKYSKTMCNLCHLFDFVSFFFSFILFSQSLYSVALAVVELTMQARLSPPHEWSDHSLFFKMFAHLLCRCVPTHGHCIAGGVTG